MRKLHLLLFILLIALSSCSKNRDDEANKKAEWITKAFESLESNSFPNIKAISWWHEDFDNSKLTVNSSPESLQAYKDAISSSLYLEQADFSGNKLLPASGIYHSAFPDFGGTEDIVSSGQINNFESLVGKQIVWAYFSNNWYDEIKFPSSEINIIHSAGRVPFIRIMPRTNFDDGGPDPNYTMQKIIDGYFDTQLIQWAVDAANCNFPLLVEFGTEVNGNWFPWNGEYNGGSNLNTYGNDSLPDGPERFRDAYRHIIDLFNSNDAINITWFFHVDAYNEPDNSWNIIENYYPGDEYIDWLGVSVYGPQKGNDDYQTFIEILNHTYPVLSQLADKPIAILEFAVTEIE